MKQRLIYIIIYGSIIGLIFFSCNKDTTSTNATAPGGSPTIRENKFPIANAGADISVNYNLQTCSAGSISLNGSASFDSDGTITAYEWKGPGLIVSPNQAITQVTNLPIGIHRFYLRVWDNENSGAKDTVIVNVVSQMNRPVANAQLSLFGMLSQPRRNIAVGSAGNKIVFAGGFAANGPSSKVDIYDINTHNWSTATLSVARANIAVASADNKIFFAGGTEGGWWDYGSMYANVDIYDAETNTWTIAQLSEARGWLAAAAIGNKILFAGGNNNNYLSSSRVDIYDLEGNSWSTSNLTEARIGLTADAANNKVYFAGGLKGSNTLLASSGITDVFNGSTGTWSFLAMGEPKAQLKSIAVNSKLIWAGGWIGNNYDGSYTSERVEIKDLNTGSSSFGCLSQPNLWDDAEDKAVIRNNEVVFFTGAGVTDKFDIYNFANDTWSIGLLNQSIKGASIISVNNSIYVAGGYVNGFLSNQVWKLDF